MSGSCDNPYSIKTLASRASDRLQAAGIENARFEAEYLLSFVLNKNRSYLYAFPDERLVAEKADAFLAAIERRCFGEPAAYITGQREFWSLDIAVDRSVLIPRPDTECIVEAVLDLPAPKNCRVIDLGTGSGAIALALASERPDWEIYASDISFASAYQAQVNYNRLHAHLGGNTMQFYVGSWLDALADNSFDIIVSNPPYIAREDIDVDESTKLEPDRALFSGDNGLADLRALIEGAPRCLRSGGRLVVEHGAYQHQAVMEIASEQYVYAEKIVDLAGHDRGAVLEARLPQG